jgi:hypothetical protein
MELCRETCPWPAAPDKVSSQGRGSKAGWAGGAMQRLPQHAGCLTRGAYQFWMANSMMIASQIMIGMGPHTIKGESSRAVHPALGIPAYVKGWKQQGGSSSIGHSSAVLQRHNMTVKPHSRCCK